ncbi:uncharacterized protein LOC127797990 [Diospyros lotus]|uniref:uncharacterized protein LOC127797990 n=1 Tax=Diospyros lotus TaxID=55363 RepID=UPI00225C25E8|nr:uncharacterized protein LOC127797990 [Diospyros lotus]
MRLLGSLWMDLFTILQAVLPVLGSQLPELSAPALDGLLQNYAFKAFATTRTGIPCNVHVPVNFSGIAVSALRLRSGSLRARGFSSFREFTIPIGVAEQPYVKRLVFVYQNLGNWSSFYYPLPGYTYLAPVLGLLAYDAAYLAAENLPQLDIRASEEPIIIKFRDLKFSPNGLLPKCVYFDSHGSVEFNNLLGGNMCSATKQGHFSIAAEEPPESGGGGGGGQSEHGEHNYGELWVIPGAVFALLVLLGMLVLCLKMCRDRKRIHKMEQAQQGSEGRSELERVGVGNSIRMPMALGTRTRPVLENEYLL